MIGRIGRWVQTTVGIESCSSPHEASVGPAFSVHTLAYDFIGHGNSNNTKYPNFRTALYSLGRAFSTLLATSS